MTGAPWLGGLMLVELNIPLAADTYLWDVAEWDASTWEGGADWQDITCFVRSIVIDRGRQPFNESFEAGTCTLLVANADGRFSPWRKQGAYSVGNRSGVQAGIKMRVSYFVGDTWDADNPWDDATDPWDGTLTQQHLFHGVVESVNEYWPDTLDAEVQINATDAFRDLAAVDLATIPENYAGDTTDARIVRILTDAENAWPTRIDAGITTLTKTAYGAQAISLIQMAALSDGGEFYVAKDGTLNFDNANRVTSDPRMTDVQATFIDCPTDTALPYFDVSIACDDDVIANVAVIGNGATTSTARDDTSISLYGVRYIRHEDFTYEPSTQGDYLAARYVDLRADAVLRVGNFSVDSRHRSWMPAVAAALELRDRIRFVRTFVAETLDAQLWVEQIRHDILPERWLLTIGTTAAVTLDVIPPDISGLGWDEAQWDTIGTWKAAA